MGRKTEIQPAIRTIKHGPESRGAPHLLKMVLRQRGQESMLLGRCMVLALASCALLLAEYLSKRD